MPRTHLVLRSPILATLLLAGACGENGSQGVHSLRPSVGLRCVGLSPTSLTETDWVALGIDLAAWRALEAPRVATGTWYDGTPAAVSVSVSLDLAAFQWERRVPLGEDAPAAGDDDGCPDVLRLAGTWRVHDDSAGLSISGSVAGRVYRDNVPYLSIVGPFTPWPSRVARPEAVGPAPTLSMSVERDRLGLHAKTAGGGDTGTDRLDRVWLEATAGE